MTQPGRSCPLHYRYEPQVLDRQAEISTAILYVIGGLYGNAPALAAIERLKHAEPGPVTLVFNGDFNWFNVDAASFSEINTRVLMHHALRGNVETEIADDDDSAGCGCGYPDSVGDDEVSRSNMILARLRKSARTQPAVRARLAALPMHLVAEVGGLRIVVVHGDCASLAGWSYDESVLRGTDGITTAAAHLAASGARIIASSHTCLPVALTLAAPQGAGALFNNGAAGMPNFAGTRFGLITRIAATPALHPAALYGAEIDGVRIDALAVEYDDAQWQQDFLANWPSGSAGHLSYFRRISSGPRYGINQAMRSGIHISPAMLRDIRASGSMAS